VASLGGDVGTGGATREGVDLRLAPWSVRLPNHPAGQWPLKEPWHDQDLSTFFFFLSLLMGSRPSDTDLAIDATVVRQPP
jgi:hypothetical protein